jgi:hydrogenase/urease accessory protein HupE
MQSRRLPLLAAAIALAPAAAFAHEGHHERMPFGEALRHLLSEPDHQVMLGLFAVLLVGGAWTWSRSQVRK